jgi:hypothetical protein
VVGLNQPRLKYRPQGDVLAAYGESREFMTVIRGPLGSGKTKGTLFKLLQLICEQRPDANGVRRSKIAAIRNTYPDLASTTIAEFRECVHPAMGKIVMGHPPTCQFDFALEDGTTVDAVVEFLALDRDEDIRKFRGMQITFIWYNELRFIPMSVITEGLSRCDRFPQPGFSPFVGGLADTNAWDEDHPLEERSQLAAEGKLEGWAFFNQPAAVLRAQPNEEGAHVSLTGGWWKINPAAENLSVLGVKYYERQIAGAKDDWIRVNLANETGLSMDGKPVHPDYSETIHRSNKVLVPRGGIPVHVGLDFGLTPAAAFSQRQPTGQWWTFDEIVCEDMGAEKLADQIKLKVAEWRQRSGNPHLEFVFRGDRSGDNRSQTDERTVFQTLAANGVVAIPSSTNDVATRRAALERPLTRMVGGQPGILFSPACKFLRKGLKGGFQYRRVKVSGTERYQDKPDKDIYSHICEAQEYALMDAGEHAVVNSKPVQQFASRGPVVPTGAITI